MGDIETYDATPIDPDYVVAKLTEHGGDVGRLTPRERWIYCQERCRVLGIEPASKPFDYLSLRGKTVLYINRTGADLLGKLHRVSIAITDQRVMDGVFVVTTRATRIDGSYVDDIGVVSLMDGGKKLFGEALANALMKAVTKGKRRALLSATGAGLLAPEEAEDLVASGRATYTTEAQLTAPGSPGTQSLPAPAVELPAYPWPDTAEELNRFAIQRNVVGALNDWVAGEEIDPVTGWTPAIIRQAVLFCEGAALEPLIEGERGDAAAVDALRAEMLAQKLGKAAVELLWSYGDYAGLLPIEDGGVPIAERPAVLALLRVRYPETWSRFVAAAQWDLSAKGGA